MAGIANPGLLLRTCTTSIFNKIKDKSDTTLYFVTPDTNNDLAGVTNMQTVSLYRGANIIEDSNVIFVRDYNLPTYIDADSEAIYYRHHCMESHAQSLTSTITGAPGQKLYVLFIDSIETSPTYNQIIDAFMYIWQTEISTVDSQQFTAKIISAQSSEAPQNSTDSRNWDTYDGVLDGLWTIQDIESYEVNDETGLGHFIGNLTCRDKDLGVEGLLKLELDDVTPGILISQDYTAFTDKDFLTTSSVDGKSVDIILKHTPMTVGSVRVNTTEKESSEATDYIVYTDNGAGKLVYNSIEYGSIDYSTGILTFTKCFSGITTISFARTCIESISYSAAPGTLVLGITKTVDTDIKGNVLPDIFTLYTGHSADAKSVLEADHDVVTSQGCWLGFCIKNDTTDLFQIVDKLNSEIKHVENELVNHYSAIQKHQRIYQDTKIDYITYKDLGNTPELDPVTGKPKLEQLARIIIDGSNGNLTIGANTNTNHVTESLTDDSPKLTYTPIVPYSVDIQVTDLNASPKNISICDTNPWYFRSTVYDEALELRVETEPIDATNIREHYYYDLNKLSIAHGSIALNLLINDTKLLLKDAKDSTNDTAAAGILILTDDSTGETNNVGTIDYNTGIINIDELVSLYESNPTDAEVTYDFYSGESTCGTLVDSNNRYWGTINYNTGEITGDLAHIITRIAETSTPADNVIVSYSHIVNTDGDADTLYLDITPSRTAFYQAGITGEALRAPATTTIDNTGNIYTAGNIDSDNHYPNSADTYDIGKADKRWNTAYADTLDARDLTKTPILEVTDIVPYNKQPNNIINIGTRNGEVEAVNINTESSNSISLKSLNQLNVETKQVTILGSEKVDVKSQDIKLLNAAGAKVLLHINESGSEFHDGIIKFNAINGQITSGTHISNEHNTYDLGTNTNRWRAIYGIESRFTNLYVDNIQTDTTGTVDINSTLETQDIRPHTDNTYDLGIADQAYKTTNVYTVAVNTIKALNAANITIESDTVINAKLTVNDSVLFENTLEVQNDATFKSDIQVNQTATINTIKAQALTISETAEFKDSEGNYIIGTEPASFVVLGEDGKRTENTLLGTKAAIIGDETDNMSDFTMHGIKKYLDYTADTLAQVIFVDCPTEEDDIEAIDNKALELEIEPVESNIAVVRRIIAIDNNDTSTNTADDITRYSYTGYVYSTKYDDDGIAWSEWRAMTGNYSAKNVYFTQDFTFTKPVGVVTQKNIDDNNGYAVRRAAGVSLQEFMSDLFSEASDPNVTNPNYTLSASATTSGDNEVGTYITALNWSGTFTAGSYPYGSVNAADPSVRYTDKNTGVTVNSYNVSCDKAGTASGQTEDGTWRLTNNITINAVGSKTYATISVTCNTNASPRIPVNNLHSPVSSLQIGTKSIPKTANVNVTGHRKMFYGSDLSKDPNLSSDSIRNLSGKKVAPSSADSSIIKVDVIENAKSIIVALPKGLYVNTLVNPNSLQDITKVAGVMTTYIEDAKDNNAIDVEGANHFTAAKYNVFVYKSNALLSESKYEMTLTNERPAWLDS